MYGGKGTPGNGALGKTRENSHNPTHPVTYRVPRITVNQLTAHSTSLAHLSDRGEGEPARNEMSSSVNIYLVLRKIGGGQPRDGPTVTEKTTFLHEHFVPYKKNRMRVERVAYYVYLENHHRSHWVRALLPVKSIEYQY